MIIHMQFAATRDRFSVRVLESEFKVDMPNAIRFDNDGRVVGFGEDEPHAGWTEKPIYDSARFEPHLLGATTYLYLKRALKRMKRRGWHELFDGYEWDLTLPGYEQIPEQVRREYERNLKALPSLRAFTINGRRTRLLPFVLRIYR
ncbi:MAG TPA: hypothetical protein VIN63_10755 [Candidatus Limnocylindria bacterium]